MCELSYTTHGRLFELTLDLKVSGKFTTAIHGLTQLTTMHRYLFFKPLMWTFLYFYGKIFCVYCRKNVF